MPTPEKMQDTARELADKPVTKKCRLCKQEKSITEFYKSHRTKGGRDTRCLYCITGKTRAEIDANKQLIAEDRARREAVRFLYWSKQSKVCYVCNKSKSWLEFMVSPYHRKYPGGRCLSCEHSPEYPAAYARLRGEMNRMRYGL
jgi:hypothetical protein